MIINKLRQIPTMPRVVHRISILRAFLFSQMTVFYTQLPMPRSILYVKCISFSHYRGRLQGKPGCYSLRVRNTIDLNDTETAIVTKGALHPSARPESSSCSISFIQFRDRKCFSIWGKWDAYLVCPVKIQLAKKDRRGRPADLNVRERSMHLTLLGSLRSRIALTRSAR